MEFTDKDIDRFVQKFEISETKEWGGTPCFEWTAAKSDKGYGCFSLGGRRHLAHRVSYQITVAPIPDGLELNTSAAIVPA